MKRLKGLSLFSGAGVGETFLSDTGIDIIVANELITKRADLYHSLYPSCKMICGDIRDRRVFDDIISSAKGVQFMIASPPCQGMSVAGKSRNQETMVHDIRNYLIEYVFEAIEQLSPSLVLIENVPTLLKIKLPYGNRLLEIVDILRLKFGDIYNIEARVVDSSDFGVPQTRLRALIKLYKNDYSWPWPEPVKKKVTVREAIGHLPSLEAGQHSGIKWHFARPHKPSNVLWMKHTPTGCTAFDNAVFFPQKEDGSRIRGYSSSYRRIRWDEPSPTITIRNDCIASQRNVHPGTLLPDGTYSDARVLTPLELMLLDSLPAEWPIPEGTPELLIRQVIGESIPPLMVRRIVEKIVCRK